MNENNLIVIKRGDKVLSTENILNEEQIKYTTYSFGEEMSNISEILSREFWLKYVSTWTNLIDRYRNNDYILILTENIYVINKEKINILIDWVSKNSGEFDIINLECAPDFLCGDKNDKIVIDSDIELYKNNINLSNTGMILSKSFMNKVYEISNLDTDLISKLISLKTNLKIYNTNPNLIYSITMIIPSIVQEQNYKNMEHIKIFHERMQALILLTIVTLALLLIYLKTNKSIIIYLILLYFALFLL
jgi:hypothetical protein